MNLMSDLANTRVWLAASSLAISMAASGCSEDGDAQQGDAQIESAAAAAGDAGVSASGKSASESPFCAAKAVITAACGDCHGQELAAGAPMPLVAYEDFVAAAPVTSEKKVFEVIGARIHDPKRPMPPQRKLTSAELATLDSWIAAGAPAGSDPSCGGRAAATAAANTGVWPPVGAENCHKLTVPGATIKAGAEPHPQFFFDAPWGDTPVQALGFRPITDNKKVLHHWILYSGTGIGGFLSGWAPGQDASAHRPLPEDVGIAMPSGKQAMRLDMHYFNLQGTTDELDSSGVEVCVTSQLRPKPAGTYMGFVGIPVLPPGPTDTIGKCDVTVKEPVFILSESPHAHQLATWMKFEVIRDGKTITLRDEGFNFEEQTSRALPAPFELKSGDQVVTTCHFENTTAKTVTFGENTGNEMCFNFATIFPLGALSCGRGGLGGFGGLGGLGGLGAGGARPTTPVTPATPTMPASPVTPATP